MGKDSRISWTDHTFNPWWGCSKVSPACEHCYAESNAKRFGFPEIWGPLAQRRFFGERHWNEPRRWNRAAEKAQKRARVFCASMGDVFEDHPDMEQDRLMDEAREKLWELIAETPWLTWMLLTKRPENVEFLVPWIGDQQWPENVWLGVTAENQPSANARIAQLIQYPAKVRFVSVEPMLGAIDLGRAVPCGYYCDEAVGHVDHQFWSHVGGGIDWVIAGGESGPKARPTHPDWVRSLRNQCIEADVPFHFKQWGEWQPMGEVDDVRVALNLQPGKELVKGGSGLRDILLKRVGRKKAGHLLDGQEWLEFPATG